MTSKRQVTIPKSVADQYGIVAGDEIEFVPAGEAIRVQRPGVRSAALDRERRLERFDQATERQQARQQSKRRGGRGDRGWRREGLYERGSAR
ncbi:MAG TPA: AbrB/MazE/SpoVT family DNA-binding domain-containing protein [Solirubrobacteraceae bacterium]